jgi:hypothetical protein
VRAVLAPGAGRRWCIFRTCGRDSASGFLAVVVVAFGAAFVAVAFAAGAFAAVAFF